MVVRAGGGRKILERGEGKGEEASGSPSPRRERRWGIEKDERDGGKVTKGGRVDELLGAGAILQTPTAIL